MRRSLGLRGGYHGQGSWHARAIFIKASKFKKITVPADDS